jgi:hypothetical protein
MAATKPSDHSKSLIEPSGPIIVTLCLITNGTLSSDVIGRMYAKAFANPGLKRGFCVCGTSAAVLSFLSGPGIVLTILSNQVFNVDRRTFSFVIASLPLWPQAARGDQKIARIGFLSPADKPGPNHRAFIDRLAKLRLVEGQTIHIEWRWLNQQYDSLPKAAEELASLDLQAVVAQTQAVTLAMKKATQTTPIVFVGVRDPVAAGSFKASTIQAATLPASLLHRQAK